MANTKSAAKQARASERRRLHNKAIKSRLHTLETKFLTLIKDGKQDEAATTYRSLAAALDKAAKVQVIHRNMAHRKKSRLAVRLKSLSPQASA